MDDLLENTNRALGLTLERAEATALISMLDVNGDKSIQCEELEVRLPLVAAVVELLSGIGNFLPSPRKESHGEYISYVPPHVCMYAGA